MEKDCRTLHSPLHEKKDSFVEGILTACLLSGGIWVLLWYLLF
jgi:hypothetical protein